jgi:hypothetical protein
MIVGCFDDLCNEVLLAQVVLGLGLGRYQREAILLCSCCRNVVGCGSTGILVGSGAAHSGYVILTTCYNAGYCIGVGRVFLGSGQRV